MVRRQNHSWLIVIGLAGGCASPGLDTQIRTLGDVATRQEQAVAKIEGAVLSIDVAGVDLENASASVQVGTGALVDATQAIHAATSQAANQAAGDGSTQQSTSQAGFLNLALSDG